MYSLLGHTIYASTDIFFLCVANRAHQECQLVTLILGISMNQCWPLVNYVSTTHHHNLSTKSPAKTHAQRLVSARHSDHRGWALIGPEETAAASMGRGLRMSV